MADLYSFTTEYGMKDELFKAVLSLDKPRVEQLKAQGVTLTEDVKRTLVNGGGPMVSNKPAAPFWYLYISDLRDVDKENFVWISRIFFEETGAPLYYSDTLHDTIREYIFNTDVFTCLMECYDHKKMNKKRIMQTLIRKHNLSHLGVCAKHGWLKQSNKRDEMIEYANEQNRPECTAWLLDFKNRTADLAAERARAEKKAEREFNAAPDSALELGKLWSWKKQEDGTLIITSYKGEETEVTVPARVGSSAVTAVADYALSPIAPKLKAPYNSRREMITKITVPSGIKTVGECAFGGSGTNTQWHSVTSRLEEISLPDTLEIFTDRQAAEAAPKIVGNDTVVAVIPNSKTAELYCIKNNIQYRFADSGEIHVPKSEIIKSDVLFAAVIECDENKVRELKKSGAVLTDRIKDCLLHEMSYGNALYDIQKELYEKIFKTETEKKRRFILSSLKAETGEPLYFDRYKYSYSFTPELFDCVLEYYNTKFLNKIKEMQRLINNEKTEHLAVCAKHGWLKNSATRDKIIQYAIDNNKTEATAWLLDYKNRTTTPEQEKKRAEKKLERELNADPFSPKEMRKLWRFAKREDGTLEITCYKGNSAEIIVPERIGGDTVTSIGEGAFTGFYSYSPQKSKDKDFCERHNNIVSITLPDTVKSIGAYAFGFCKSLREIVIPSSVKLIGANAFIDGMLRINPNITFTVERDSFAERFCKKYGVKFKYKDEG